MNEENDDTQKIPATENTHRYGPPEQGQSYPQAGPPPSYSQPPHGADQLGEQPGPFGFYGQPSQSGPRRQTKPSSAFTAGILAAALVVGGLGGLAGAAGFAAVDYLNGDGTSAASPPVSNAEVSDRKDTTAEPGSVEDVANSVLPSVVKISVQGAQGEGSGSGVIISSDGEILTNNHVVEVAASGGSLSVNFNDGSAATAEIVGTDPVTDLAVIKAQDVSGLTPATIGESGNLDVGEEVVAVGSPFGLEATVTSGIVSALNRPVSVGSSGPDATATTYPAIQTDAAINPGNSGWPAGERPGRGSRHQLLDPHLGFDGGGRFDRSRLRDPHRQGAADRAAAARRRDAHARPARGHRHRRLQRERAAQRRGYLVGEQRLGRDEAGLRTGDVVTKVNDELISSSDSLVATIRGFRPGDTVTLTVVRGGDETSTVDVTLDSDEGSPTS